jgi:REP element-mobilizing transposase RayT
MPRTARLLIEEEETIYHVISRTALPGYPFEDAEKDFLVEVIKRFSALYCTEVLGFCVMGNHFHLAVRMLPESQISDKEIKERFARFYGKNRQLTDGQIPFYRHKWCSLSEFIKEIKQTFSRYFNKRHNRKGYLWGERFKSVIVEKGDTLVNCLAYIDLNPLRAGIVERPEDYRWCSLGYHAQTGNRGEFLSLEFGLNEFGEKGGEERFRRYREFVYEVGALEGSKGAKIENEVLEQERKKDFELTGADRFRYRTRYFTESGIIGSKEYVRQNFQRFKNLFQTKNDRMPKKVTGLAGVYSMRRLG